MNYDEIRKTVAYAIKKGWAKPGPPYDLRDADEIKREMRRRALQQRGLTCLGKPRKQACGEWKPA